MPYYEAYHKWKFVAILGCTAHNSETVFSFQSIRSTNKNSFENLQCFGKELSTFDWLNFYD